MGAHRCCTTSSSTGAFSDAQIKSAISDGLKRDKDGVKQEMEAYKAKLRPDQIDGLVAQVRALKK